jgi:hypothetical protein
MDAVADGLGTGRFDRRQPIGKHRGEDVDHLSFARLRIRYRSFLFLMTNLRLTK